MPTPFILASGARLCKLFFASGGADTEQMMSNVVSGTMARPASRYDAIRALLRAGKNDEAIVQLCAISIVKPDDSEARELLFDAFFQKRDWAPRSLSSSG